MCIGARCCTDNVVLSHINVLFSSEDAFTHILGPSVTGREAESSFLHSVAANIWRTAMLCVKWEAQAPRPVEGAILLKLRDTP